jgi:DNA-binding CsgD family transcriptional regulator
MKLARFSSLIEGLYDAALDVSDWPPLASTFAQAFGAESCVIHSLDLANGESAISGQTANFDAKAIETYQAHYHKVDILALRMATLGIGSVMLGTEVSGETEWFNSEIFNDYGRRLGITWVMGSMIPVDEHVVGALGVHRPYGAANFEINDKRRLSRLLPHLSRAMLLQRRINGLVRDRRIALEALENLGTGVIAVDADSVLLFANRTAERLLRSGLGLTIRQNRLYATDQSRADELRRLIHHAARAALGRSAEADGMLTLPRREGRPLSLLVCPLRPDAMSMGPPTATALIFLGDPDADRPTPQHALIDLYGLTPAEARLMAALVDGERLEHFADRRGISINTVKAQSKQVFAKTGHGRQADVIREVLANPAIRANIGKHGGEG